MPSGIQYYMNEWMKERMNDCYRTALYACLSELEIMLTRYLRKNKLYVGLYLYIYLSGGLRVGGGEGSSQGPPNFYGPPNFDLSIIAHFTLSLIFFIVILKHPTTLLRLREGEGVLFETMRRWSFSPLSPIYRYCSMTRQMASIGLLVINNVPSHSHD